MGKWTRWVELSAVLVATVGAAPAAHADESVVTIRYKQADEVGFAIGSGGGYAALRGWPEVPVPDWAKSATVRIVDDRGLPVAGKADVYAGARPGIRALGQGARPSLP